MQGPQLCAKPCHFCKLDVATSRMAFLDLNLHVLQVATPKSTNSTKLHLWHSHPLMPLLSWGGIRVFLDYKQFCIHPFLLIFCRIFYLFTWTIWRISWSWIIFFLHKVWPPSTARWRSGSGAHFDNIFFNFSIFNFLSFVKTSV